MKKLQLQISIFVYIIKSSILQFIQPIYYKLISLVCGIDISMNNSPDASLKNHEYFGYQHSDSRYLRIIMHYFKITKKDSIFDYGCGKGGALIFFSSYNFNKIAGIEIIIELCKIAKANATKKGKSNIEIYNGNAAEYTQIDEYNYFYFFNPFIGETLKSVIEQIKQSFYRKNRTITILYKNPICREYFLQSGIFIYIKHCCVSFIKRNNVDINHCNQFIDIYSTQQSDNNFIK